MGMTTPGRAFGKSGVDPALSRANPTLALRRPETSMKVVDKEQLFFEVEEASTAKEKDWQHEEGRVHILAGIDLRLLLRH